MFGTAACGSAPSPVAWAPVDIPVPTGATGGMYSLAADRRDGALLSWLEPSQAGRVLRFAFLDGHTWGAPRTITEGRHLFSNWADHPSVAVQPDGTLLAQWPVINDGPQPPGSYNNSMRIALSHDRGLHWTEVYADGLDNTHSYTGFVSLLPTPAGAHAVYLSPPRPISHDPLDHRMTLSHAAFDAHGTKVTSGVIDGDTCSCCPTAMGLTGAGPIAAYRDHEPGEIRDIAIVRFVNGAWTPPATVHRDGWEINGCPTNGPSIGATGARVAVAWFTAAAGEPRVKLAFSQDSGATFGAPIQIDGQESLGRTATVLLQDGSAVVAWLASPVGTNDAVLRIRRVAATGTAGPVVVVGPAAPGRVSGMPQLVEIGDQLLTAWRGAGEQLRTVLLPIPSL